MALTGTIGTIVATVHGADSNTGQYCYGSFTQGATAGTPIAIDMGFTPRKFKIMNSVDGVIFEWWAGMPDASYWDWTAGAFDYEAADGFTPLDGSATVAVETHIIHAKTDTDTESLAVKYTDWVQGILMGADVIGTDTDVMYFYAEG